MLPIWNLACYTAPANSSAFRYGVLMQRTIRYQGAVLRDDHILLIQHRHYSTGHSYWLLPGGGREGEETAEACVQREVREETHLHVQVGQHLLDDPDMPGLLHSHVPVRRHHPLLIPLRQSGATLSLSSPRCNP
jgi:8-oxo-dGTP pyrophosphatase MutT (NUDIX family)